MELQSVSIAFITLTSGIGFISFFATFVTILKWIWVSFLRPPKNLKDYGSWAVITGSTDGIGKALAFELASKGLNIVLIGRNPSKLQDTSNEIREKQGRKVEIRTVVIDFSKDDGEEVVKKLEKEVSGLDVGVLINNAGFSYPYAKYFHEVEEIVDDIVKVNIIGATWVTRAVLPVMLKKKKGAIINIGSGSGSTSVVPSYPLYTVYAASKAYTGMFSRSINLEYKQQGIDIQCQIPLLVATKMTSIKRSSFFVPSPETFSKASLRWIGYEHTCVPYWTHSIQCCLLRAFPDALLNKMLLQYFLSVRKRGVFKDSVKSNKKSSF